MKKVVTINLGGNAYQVDEDGYESLESYLTDPHVRLGSNPKTELNRGAALFHHADEAGHARDRVRHVNLEGVGRRRYGGPQTLAGLHRFGVFGDLQVGGQRHRAWIMRDERGNIGIRQLNRLNLQE